MLPLVAHSLPNRGVINETTIRTSFSIINCQRYFDFMTATAENPVSHEYFVTKGSKTFIALSGKLVQSFSTSS